MRAILSGEPNRALRVDTSNGFFTIADDRPRQSWERAFIIMDKHEVRALRDLLNDPETMRLFP